MITTGVMFGSGDVLAQKLFPPVLDSDESKKSKSPKVSISPPSSTSPILINSSTDIVVPFNYARTLRAIIYGSIFFAPIVVVWQGKILPRLKNPFIRNNHRLNMSARKLHVFDTVFRVTVDQLIMPGLVLIPLYNTVMVFLAMHDNPLEIIHQKLTNNWWTVLKAGWTVWPTFQLVNLLFIPIHLRVLAANIWSIGWNCFLSFCHNTKGHGKGSGHRFEEIVDIQDDELAGCY